MKRPTRIVLLCLWLLSAALSLAAPQASAPREETQLARGVIYRHIATQTPAGEPWSIHVLEISRQEKALALRTVRGAGAAGEMQRERPSEMALRAVHSNERLLAAVNGDFDLGEPYLGIPEGLAVTDGNIFTTGVAGWPVLGLQASGAPVIGVPQVEIEVQVGKTRLTVAALNKPFGQNFGTGIRLFTREFRAAARSGQVMRGVVMGRLSRTPPLRVDATVRGVVEKTFENAREITIPAGTLVLAARATGPDEELSKQLAALRLGAKVKLTIRVRVAGEKHFREVIGGNPILVQQGRRAIAATANDNLMQRRHPRTAVCYNGVKIIFAVVDGRQPHLSVGMTLGELADLMVSLGCETAMNTDGGGSSVMAVALAGAGLRIVNSPSDGQERGRGNAWVLVEKH